MNSKYNPKLYKFLYNLDESTMTLRNYYILYNTYFANYIHVSRVIFLSKKKAGLQRSLKAFISMKINSFT